MPHSLVMVYLHLICSTYQRRDLLPDPELRQALHHYLWKVSDELKYPALAVGGTANHIHMLVRMGKERTLPGWVQEVKRVSSMWMHETQARPDFRWQSGYACYSWGYRAVPRVIRYIGNQEAHHKEFSYEDEIRKLIIWHETNTDEDQMWDLYRDHAMPALDLRPNALRLCMGHGYPG